MGPGMDSGMMMTIMSMRQLNMMNRLASANSGGLAVQSNMIAKVAAVRITLSWLINAMSRINVHAVMSRSRGSMRCRYV